jgi:hypothetical protein
MLLPLLMKEEFLYKDFWSPDMDLAAVGAALHLVMRELRQHWDNYLSAIQATVQAQTLQPQKKALPQCQL